MKKLGKKPFFEPGYKPLLEARLFYRRQFQFVLYAVVFLALCLGIGMVGYHSIVGMDWITAYYNATMILSGMGEVDHMPTQTAKIFSGSYALFSGVVFLSTIAVMFAPVVHRLLHLMHMEEQEDKE